MKHAWIAALCLAFAGCDYTVPIAATPARDIDRALVGLWERTDDGDKPESLLVLPLGPREYLVNYPLDKRDGLFAKATLCSCAGRTWAQIQWFGTAKGTQPDDARIYQFATYEQTNDTLRIRLLNPDVVSKDMATTADLVHWIEANRDEPKLLREPMSFKRIKE